MFIQTQIKKEVLIIPAVPNFRQVRVYHVVRGEMDRGGQSTSKIEAGETKFINMALVASMKNVTLKSETVQHSVNPRGGWYGNVERVLNTLQTLEVVRVEFIPTLDLGGLWVEFLD